MNLHLVLVRTENSANLGASARVLANMGGQRLILIDPQCEINAQARSLAAGAHEKLNDIVSYGSWDEFYRHEGTGLRIALTRRGGQQRKVTALKDELARTTDAPEHFYLILGPERDGLDAADMAHANFACHLPTFGDFASMNLSQAALLGLYMVRERFPPEILPAQTTSPPSPAVAPFYFPDDTIRAWLTAMGFDVNARRQSAFLTLRRLLLANAPTRHELQVLEAVLHQNIRKLGGVGAEEAPSGPMVATPPCDGTTATRSP